MENKEIVEMLGLDIDLDSMANKGPDFVLHQIKRRVRYWCFSLQRVAVEGAENTVPEKFSNYFENTPGFEGWKNFAKTWDVLADAPYTMYPRTFSIHEEWDATIRRVVPELPVDRQWRQGDGE